ncbi:MAG: glycosyltransferase family 4 protein [Acidobacteriota bacterium]
MSYSVTIYCPDTHFVYDAKTPDRVGVGGGVTARLRLAQALADIGNKVTLVANVPRTQTYRGVHYRRLSEVRSIDSDILILNTSGGALDLSGVSEMEVRANLKVLWVMGTSALKSLDQVDFDYLIAPSNFVREVAEQEWHVSPDRLFVISNGHQRITRRRRWRGTFIRDPFRLVYSSFPSKGLDAAIGVLRLLRSEEPRFELHVYGGNALWGAEQQAMAPESGVFDHGLTGQHKLFGELLKSSFAVNLQSMPEGFPIAANEAMACGNIVLASPVGPYEEMVNHGYDGFIVPGDHLASDTLERAASLILSLKRNPPLAEYVRRNAIGALASWDVLAKVWQGHWQWALSGKERGENIGCVGYCSECSGPQLALADGYHCTGCGRYHRALLFNRA